MEPSDGRADREADGGAQAVGDVDGVAAAAQGRQVQVKSRIYSGFFRLSLVTFAFPELIRVENCVLCRFCSFESEFALWNDCFVRFLASAGKDATIRIWDTVSYQVGLTVFG